MGRGPIGAIVVDHVRPHRGDMVLFWDVANWQSLCLSCHNRKSALERLTSPMDR